MTCSALKRLMTFKEIIYISIQKDMLIEINRELFLINSRLIFENFICKYMYVCKIQVLQKIWVNEAKNTCLRHYFSKNSPKN